MLKIINNNSEQIDFNKIESIKIIDELSKYSDKIILSSDIDFELGDEIKLSSDKTDFGNFFVYAKNFTKKSIEIEGFSLNYKLKINTKTRSFFKIFLKSLIDILASELNLKLISNIEDIFLDFEVQQNETNISFISRLAFKFGFIFQIKHNNLIFIKKPNSKPSSINLDDFIFIEIRKEAKKYSAVKINYWDFDESKAKSFETSINTKTNFKDNLYNKKTLEKILAVNSSEAILTANSLLNKENQNINGEAKLSSKVIFAGSIFNIPDYDKSKNFQVRRAIFDFGENGFYNSIFFF